MKKISLFLVGLVAMLGFGASVRAAGTISLACTKTEIAPGESTNCTVSFTNDTAIKLADITLDTNKYLIVSDAKAQTGWTAVSGTVAPKYSFQSSAGAKNGAIFAFTVTLSKEAASLPENEDCGQLCIDAAFFDGTDLGVKDGTGTCFLPTVVEKTDTKNPETGAFANYAAIIGVGVVAIGAIVVARKSSKFSRI